MKQIDLEIERTIQKVVNALLQDSDGINPIFDALKQAFSLYE